MFEKGVFQSLGDRSNDTWTFRGNLAARGSDDGKWGADVVFAPMGEPTPSLPPEAYKPSGE
ncbi:hypothetical protein [Streptomyces sp. NPDC048516]|uniref:hypothetical protein n=1 Tax=Streptomyces sp. NPDC048516 TaxID=3365565 RepID=UPI003716788D